MGSIMLNLSTAKKFQFVGGNLALDFCNTMGGKRGATTRDLLGSCFDYLAWCLQAGVIDVREGRALAVRADREPATAVAALNRATELREGLFRIFAALITGRPPPRSDLAALNAQLSQSLGRLQVAASRDQGGFVWKWAGADGDLERPVGPIAHAAATLLADAPALARLCMCGGDNCGWLFLDSSKNHSRRWCDMRDCGNRAKIRRHRLKQRQAIT